MYSQIREIYRELQEAKTFKSGREVLDREIEEVLKTEREKLTDRAYEEYRDKCYGIAMLAEENGFVKGFTYAARLLTECYRG